jgi:hypothetical protein
MAQEKENKTEKVSYINITLGTFNNSIFRFTSKYYK